jgi:hypothetical protein
MDSVSASLLPSLFLHQNHLHPLFLLLDLEDLHDLKGHLVAQAVRSVWNDEHEFMKESLIN